MNLLCTTLFPFKCIWAWKQGRVESCILIVRGYRDGGWVLPSWNLPSYRKETCTTVADYHSPRVQSSWHGLLGCFTGGWAALWWVNYPWPSETGEVLVSEEVNRSRASQQFREQMHGRVAVFWKWLRSLVKFRMNRKSTIGGRWNFFYLQRKKNVMSSLGRHTKVMKLMKNGNIYLT